MRGVYGARSVTIALVAIVALLVSQLHFLVVPHTVCVAHGELVHDQDHDHDEAHDEALAEGGCEHGSNGPFVGAVPPSPDSHGHDHCLVCSKPEKYANLQSPLGVPFPRPHADPQHASGLHWTLPGQISLLFIAPKNSPPV